MTDSTTSRGDVNAQFDTDRQGQILSLVAMREDHQRRIADFESGAAQFAIDAEIARRISAGEIEMVGPDRYNVLQGWDRGEIFRVQQATRPGELTLIEPESGLDFINGQFQGVFAQPEWHGLGRTDVADMSDIDAVLDASGLNFEVLQRPVRYFDDSGELRTLPDAFVNYRSDNGGGLGVVGKVYTVIQNREGFQFLQSIVDDGTAKFASAFPMNDGRRCVISMELPEGITIDAEGVSDHIRLYLAWFNNHDGQGQLQCKVTPWRPRCGNTERLALRDALTSWGTRHTRNAMDRAEEARRQLGMGLAYAESYKAEETQLIRSAATMDDIKAVMAEIWPAGDEPSKHWQTTNAKRTDALEALWGGYRTELGGNKYAAERVFTDFFDNVAPRRLISEGGSMAAARATAALAGNDDKAKAKAHAKLMQLAAA